MLLMIEAKIVVNDLPSSINLEEFDQEPFCLLIDYMHRNAISKLTLLADNSKSTQSIYSMFFRKFPPFDNEDSLNTRRANEGYIKTRRAIDRLIVGHKFASFPLGSWETDDKSFIVFCSELAQSTTIEDLTLAYIKFSSQHTELLVASILENPNIKLINLIDCDPDLIEAMQNVEKMRPGSFNCWTSGELTQNSMVEETKHSGACIIS